MKNKRFMSTKQLVLAGVMTALVIVLQLLSTTPIFGPFSTAVALVPITIGSCLCGPIIGAWLGFIFALVVLFTGGASLFFAYSPLGTIIIVILKGALCGLAAGFVYKALNRVNDILAGVTAAIICPVTNTAVFILGSLIFLSGDAQEIGAPHGFEGSPLAIFWAFAMVNFIFEFGMCTVLSPVIVKLINIRKKQNI